MSENETPAANAEPCLQCIRTNYTGDPIPNDEITPEMARGFCRKCRHQLPFEFQDCPVSLERLRAMCEFITLRGAERGWENNLCYVEEYCYRDNLPTKGTLAWLEEQGATSDDLVGPCMEARYFDSDEN